MSNYFNNYWGTFKTMSKKEKIIIVVLCVWSFVNTYIIIMNSVRSFTDLTTGRKFIYINDHYELAQPIEYFYHFNNMDLADYDFTEYFVYVIGVWMVFFLYRFLQKK